jgi:hypothetical protein
MEAVHNTQPFISLEMTFLWLYRRRNKKERHCPEKCVSAGSV